MFRTLTNIARALIGLPEKHINGNLPENVNLDIQVEDGPTLEQYNFDKMQREALDPANTVKHATEGIRLGMAQQILEDAKQLRDDNIKLSDQLREALRKMEAIEKEEASNRICTLTADALERRIESLELIARGGLIKQLEIRTQPNNVLHTCNTEASKQFGNLREQYEQLIKWKIAVNSTLQDLQTQIRFARGDASTSLEKVNQMRAELHSTVSVKDIETVQKLETAIAAERHRITECFKKAAKDDEKLREKMQNYTSELYRELDKRINEQQQRLNKIDPPIYKAPLPNYAKRQYIDAIEKTVHESMEALKIGEVEREFFDEVIVKRKGEMCINRHTNKTTNNGEAYNSLGVGCNVKFPREHRTKFVSFNVSFGGDGREEKTLTDAKKSILKSIKEFEQSHEKEPNDK